MIPPDADREYDNIQLSVTILSGFSLGQKNASDIPTFFPAVMMILLFGK